MGACTLVMVAMAARIPRGDRIFYYINIAIVATACIAYYTMGSDLGYTPINVEFNHMPGANRQIFYTRYIYW